MLNICLLGKVQLQNALISIVTVSSMTQVITEEIIGVNMDLKLHHK